MARTARIKQESECVANYHLMSRTNNKVFLFADPHMRDLLVEALRRAAAFSGVELLAFTIMFNHFHAITRVDRTGGPVPEEELIRRVGILKGEDAAQELREHWANLRKAGDLERLDAEQTNLRRRMNDISEFMKTFKEMSNILFKKQTKYCGSIWSGRFKSTLIEDGKYLATCMRYAYYNPIRAGIVRRAADYRWCWIKTLEAGSVPAFAAGSVPDGLLLKRIAQIGAGKVFGSLAFVTEKAAGLGHRIKTRSVAAHPVGEIGYSTHGWRLAQAAA